MSEQSQPEHIGLPLVAYTDGGSRGREQYAGAGLHGYFYDPSKTVEKPITTTTWKKDQPTTFGYTDANNYQQMAESYKAQVVTPKVFIDGVAALGASTTNNVAELEAAIWALQVASSAKSPKLTVLADSEYVVKGVSEYIDRWRDAGWTRATGQPLANAELWKNLDNELISFRGLDHAPSVQFLWTAAHVGNYGNERADTLATRGVYASKGMDANCTSLKELDYSPAQGYLNPKVDYNRLLAGQHFYFFSNAKEARRSRDGRAIYYMGCQGGDKELHGKPVSDSTYIVAYLKEGDRVIDHLIERQEVGDAGTYGRSYRGELTTLLHAKLYADLKTKALPWVRAAEPNHDLYLDDVLLIEERTPPLLAWRDEEALSLVRGLLEQFLAQQQEQAEKAKLVDIPGLVVYDRLGHRGTKPLAHDVVVTEVSNLFFVAEDSKKKNTHKLTEFLGQSTRSVDVVANYNTTGELASAKISLTVGQDIARRNTLGALLAQNPRLFVLTWRASSHGFNYATVIQTDDDVAIWCSVHANLRVVNPNDKPSKPVDHGVVPAAPVVEVPVKEPKAKKKKAKAKVDS